MRTLKHGGDIKIGDFVAISYGHGFSFGWYCGEGKNTLQFFEYNMPLMSLIQYNQIKSDKAYHNHEKANSEEFNKNWIGKYYVKDWYWRVMKIENPEAIFTEQENLDRYIESKQILEQIKFI